MSSLTYKDAGVNISKGNELVNRIKPLAAKTKTNNVLTTIGGFGAGFAVPKGYENPVLISATDGVGTKLKLAQILNNHTTIGIDLVAMCVNDIICCGAKPLFFLDYYATSTLNNDVAAAVINSIADGCLLAKCALVGGETAEMPNMYQREEYDLAGFCVGIVEKDNIIDGNNVAVGDSIIAIASSGAHSNGYSLVNKLIIDKKIDNKQLSALLEPTKIYVTTILSLIKKIKIKAIANITGGGLIENIPRVFPDNLTAKIDTNCWQLPDIFTYLQQAGNIENIEMFRVFNCGIGMVIIVANKDIKKTIAQLKSTGEQAFVIGHIIDKKDKKIII